MPITLATFNVKDLLDPSHAAKLAWTAEMIDRVDADVLALEEVGEPPALAGLVARLAAGRYREPVVGTPDKRGIRNAILSRLPILESFVHTAAALALPVFREGDPPPYAGRIPLRRGVVFARVDAGGDLGVVEVFAAHFKSRRPVPLRTAAGEEVPPASAQARAEGELRSLVWRAAEALFVRGLVDARLRRDPAAKVAVMGDLNDTPESMTLEILRGAATEAGALVCPAPAVPMTERFSVLHEGTRTQIDHVLLTENLHARVESVKFFNEALREHPKIPDTGAVAAPPTVDSDHAPFAVRLRA